MHNLKYSLKTLFRKKTLIFWTYAFPIILGLLFNFAFKDLESNDKLNTIDIAIVNNENLNEYYKQAFNSLSSGEDKIFKVKYTSIKKSKELLSDKKIAGYIDFSNDAKIYVNENGYEQTVIKYVTDELVQKEKMINSIINEQVKNYSSDEMFIQDMNSLYLNALSIIESNTKDNVKNISPKKLSYTMIEFYTLIAMACLYGAMLGSSALNENLANMSSNGKRIAVSKTSKKKIVITSAIAAYIAQLGGLLLLFLFTIFGLKIDYGTNLPLIILLALVGALSGLSLGICISSVFKTNENNKTGIIISITMLCSFLSGMMGVSMKYIIDKNIPIINKINPASMITDGFYSLYYYDTLDRYYFNIISLLVFSIILLIISINSLRRQKYDSI